MNATAEEPRQRSRAARSQSRSNSFGDDASVYSSNGKLVVVKVQGHFTLEVRWAEDDDGICIVVQCHFDVAIFVVKPELDGS
jgi:hypothetical protein